MISTEIKQSLTTVFCNLIKLVLFQTIFITSVYAAKTNSSINNHLTEATTTPWDITADYFSYHGKKKTYKLIGNVIIKKKHIKVSGNCFLFDRKNMTIDTNNGVSIQIGEDSLTCDTLKLNLNQETGILYNGTIFLKEKHLKISGNKIAKTGENTYVVTKGTLTTCIGNNPDWIISGEKILVEKGKYGTLKNGILKVKKIPIIYLPYFLFPTTKRQTGLLSPEIRYKNGTINYTQPLFLKVNEASDITLYPSYELDTGVSIGLEYRYILNKETKGLFMIDLVKNKQNTTKSKIQNIKTKIESIPSNRYWIRAKCTHKLPLEFTAKLGINLVSDSKYLEDYREGYSGFKKTEQYYKNFMEKDLSPYGNNLKENYLSLSKSGSNFVFNTATYWDKNSIKHKFSKKNTLSEFDLIRQKLKLFPFYFSMNLSHKHQDINKNIEKHLTELKTRLYAPYAIGNFMIMDISVGSCQIISNFSSNKTSSKNNENYDLKLDIFSEFSKVWNKTATGTEALKHSVELRATHKYCKNYKNSTTYSISNSIISKAKNILTVSETSNKKYKYRQLCCFRFEQSFNGEKSGKQFSNVVGELNININDTFALETLVEWDPYIDSITSHSLELYSQKNKNYYIALSYLYEKNKSEIIKTSVGASLSKNITATATYGYNRMENKKSLESLGLSYNSQCWSANINYEENKAKDSRSISLSFELSGFGNHNKQIQESGFHNTNNIFLHRKQWESIK